MLEIHNKDITRLISPDFSLTLRNMFNIIGGYFTGLAIYSISLCLLYPTIFGNRYSLPTSILALASALGLCFSARVITRIYGHIYGKQYLTALTISSSFIIIIKGVVYGYSLVNSLEYHFLSTPTYNMFSVLENYYNMFLSSSKDNAVFILVGIISSISIGEFLIMKSQVKKRSILTTFDKFDSIFDSISTREKSFEKMDAMTQELNDSREKLKSIKMITRTLGAFERVYDKVDFEHLDFKIIAPNLWEETDDSDYHIKHWRERRQREYNDKLKILKAASSGKNENKVKWHKENFNNLKIFIINDKRLLLSINDGGKGRSSLYTTNPYVVRHFVQVFNGFFEATESSEKVSLNLNNYKKALPIYQRALEIYEQALGMQHPSVAETLNNLAGLYQQMGDYEKALPLYQKIGDYENALPLYQRALDIREKVLGPQHLDVAETLNNLAGLYESMRDYENALPLYQRALDIREKVLGPQHLDVAETLNNLAGLYESMRDYENALPLYQRALDIREKVLGPQHPFVATALKNFALLYHQMGDYEKAIGDYKNALPLYQRALDIREKVLGPQHLDVAETLNNLAGLYQQMGDCEKALPLYQKALKIYEDVLGPQNNLLQQP